jgi:site-specific DNA-methyltransferase (adenine-specific)
MCVARNKRGTMKTNLLYLGDNKDVLRNHFKDETVDLIYLDPPFNSKKDYNLIFADEKGVPPTSQIRAFDDTWHWGEAAEDAYRYLIDSSINKGQVRSEVSNLIGAMRSAIGENEVMAYLVFMGERLLELHRVLKPTGSIYLHCDPAASHYLKILMDSIFGARNFRREIVWRSGWVSGFKTAAKNWVRNHDILLYYVKDITASYTFNKDLAYLPHQPGYTRRGGGGNPKGVAIDDVWTDIYSPWIMSYSKEKLGWPTQKPFLLLKRIIEISSRPDDLVLDPFCGSGTTIVAAEALGRKWIGIDITPLAIAITRNRLRESLGVVDVPVDGEPADLAEETNH